jgi:hypothetical protein
MLNFIVRPPVKICTAVPSIARNAGGVRQPFFASGDRLRLSLVTLSGGIASGDVALASPGCLLLTAERLKNHPKM